MSEPQLNMSDSFSKGKFPKTFLMNVAKSHVSCIGNNRRLIVGKEVKTLIELSQIS